MALELTLALTALALLFEAAFGYPAVLYRVIGHPVGWIGRLIAGLERVLNREEAAPGERRLAGVATLLVILGASLVPGFLLQSWLLSLPFGLFILAIFASSLLAQRSLHQHVERVAQALDRSLDEGREAVAQIVGRDPHVLDEAGVARAAIESLAENFSDGIVAPALWMAVGGLGGAAAYKAVNTADSMIGHRNRRYLEFGWASARFDDLINLPAARLAGALIVVAAVMVPGASAADSWRAIRRDARRHRSPNAGWPEAAMAGALGLALAGPRHYGGQLSVDGYMGEGGRRDCTQADIRRALRLYRVADTLLVALVLAGAAAALFSGM
ncbi:adenosylcobinamide-phosphate synthase CbiB [Ancylobacter sp. A5.8]|uniref:adenosylcobinamide-phosphate synthase CbiB n=1 Tax=Ancylobacter gelatini TaxID=2919920 RepID=UPI001F4EED80|nr:adenosylcobinamide-phosphate synthase CbiB [Ancylobacter gelatini]MCJ8141953.1 adenosylcobinamide-phosphate synthase CbiB [Ancylobacter gelatini]